MHEALLYQKLKNKTVRCGVCQHRCLINEGQWGFCKTRVNKDGKLYTTIYSLVSSVNIDPIEKKPVFHYKPGSLCFSLGTYGCNFRCLFCQNWEIAWADGVAETKYGQKISPEQAIALARKYDSAGIAITYNEPAIWLEYSLDVFKLAKRPHLRGGVAPAAHLGGELYTCWVTNGYATPEAIDIIAPHLDIYRVDLKSFENNFYRKLIKIPSGKQVFETTKYVRQKYPNIHIECVTNIIPRWNDSDKKLKKIASWIVKNLGPKTPWHVTRFFPNFAPSEGGASLDKPHALLPNFPTTPETLFKAKKIGEQQGLKFVYIGNMEVETEGDTFCPSCGNLVIRRTGYLTEILGVDNEGRCSDCQEDLNIII